MGSTQERGIRIAIDVRPNTSHLALHLFRLTANSEVGHSQTASVTQAVVRCKMIL